MKVIDLINSSKSTAFSFEILPPLKGNSIQKVYNVIDKLIEFDPKYINITSHHSEYIYKTLPDGSFQKVNIRKRPGSVAIASAIQNKYGITAVPHIICKGFTKDETEYALIDLNFLGVYDLLLLRGDVKTLEAGQKTDIYHEHATDLQQQVNDFNKGIAIDGSVFCPASWRVSARPQPLRRPGASRSSTPPISRDTRRQRCLQQKGKSSSARECCSSTSQAVQRIFCSAMR